MKRRIATVLVLGWLALPAAGAGAQPSIYTQVLHAYQQHGSVPPCQFTSRQLATALHGIDTYGAQYFQDFTTAVQAALSARAGGACAATRARAVAVARPASGRPLRLGPVTAATGAGVPAALVILGVGVFALALGRGALALGRWSRWEPAALRAWRHACRETGGRLETAWLDFADWLRSGRDQRRSTTRAPRL